jgi:hypothetical protein
MRVILHKLCDSHATYHRPAEPLATDEITVVFKGSVIFKQLVARPERTGWVYKAFRGIFFTFIAAH